MFFLIANCIIAQKTCEDSQILLEDLNSINKCFINHPSKKEKSQELKKNREVKLATSTSKKRFFTVRKQPLASSLHNNINSNGIKETNNTLEIESLIALRKDYSHKIHHFTEVDRIPVFKTCSAFISDEEQHICFNKKMMQFINNNLEYSDAVLDEGFSGKISVKFVIDANGETNNIQATGFKKARILKESIINLVAKLPVFEPAKKNNRTIPVFYEFSLNFSL